MRLKIAVAVPTFGRAAVLAETLDQICQQVRVPDRLLICCTTPEHAPHASAERCRAEVLYSDSGSSRQRNALLDAARDCDLIVFFDDDFFPRSDYLKAIEQVFLAAPRVVIATGAVIADGIRGPGIPPAQGREILSRDTYNDPAPKFSPIFGAYGCNMTVRMEVVRRNAIRFDERLPLYGWQEDVDLACRLGAFGDVVGTESARGVHLGVKAGRGPGVRLGYSQVANPLYIHRKLRSLGTDTYSLSHALKLVSRNVLANMAHAFRPEPFVDRRGRLKGNLLAFRDLLNRRLAPERILEF